MSPTLVKVSLVLIGLLAGGVGGYVVADDSQEIAQLRETSQREQQELLDSVEGLQTELDSVTEELDAVDVSEVTPTSCIEALDLAQDYVDLTTNDLLPLTGGYVNLLDDAYTAGLAQGDANEVIQEGKELGAEMNRLTREARRIFSQSKIEAADCRQRAEP